MGVRRKLLKAICSGRQSRQMVPESPYMQLDAIGQGIVCLHRCKYPEKMVQLVVALVLAKSSLNL